MYLKHDGTAIDGADGTAITDGTACAVLGAGQTGQPIQMGQLQ